MDEFLAGWKAIARALKIHERTAQRYAQLYKLPVCKIGKGSIRITVRELRRWVRKQRKS